MQLCEHSLALPFFWIGMKTDLLATAEFSKFATEVLNPLVFLISLFVIKLYSPTTVIHHLDVSNSLLTKPLYLHPYPFRATLPSAFRQVIFSRYIPNQVSQFAA